MEKKLIGVDVFVNSEKLPVEMAPELESHNEGGLCLKGISNRGTRVWPGKTPNILLVDVFQCRFLSEGHSAVDAQSVTTLLAKFDSLKLDWVHVEKLYLIDGKDSYSQMHGV